MYRTNPDRRPTRPTRPTRARALRALLLLGAVAALGACDDDDPTGPDATQARLRVLHASPNAGAVDVLVDAATVRGGLQYGQVIDYTPVAPGARTLRVRPAGTTTDAISATPTLAAGADYTVIALGRAGGQGALALGALLLTDDAAPAAGAASVRVVHAAPAAGAVDVYVTAPNADLATATATLTNVPFGAASPYLNNVPPGTYQVRVVPAGTRTVAIDVPSVTLAAGQVRTAVAVGEGTAGQPLAIQLLVDRN